MALFENYERRIEQINKTLNKYGISSLAEARSICEEKGIDPYKIAKEIQPICFENAGWAYVVGAALAIKKGTGARALRSLLEKLMLDVMYDAPGSEDVQAVTISRAVVLGDSKPIIRRKETKAAA